MSFPWAWSQFFVMYDSFVLYDSFCGFVVNRHSYLEVCFFSFYLTEFYQIYFLHIFIWYDLVGYIWAKLCLLLNLCSGIILDSIWKSHMQCQLVIRNSTISVAHFSLSLCLLINIYILKLIPLVKQSNFTKL